MTMPHTAKIIRVEVQDHINLLTVHHTGDISWEEMQAVKSLVWGADAVAVEIYPKQSQVVNSGNYRHLWRKGAGDFVPDLMGEHGDLDESHGPSLREKYLAGDAADRLTLE